MYWNIIVLALGKQCREKSSFIQFYIWNFGEITGYRPNIRGDTARVGSSGLGLPTTPRPLSLQSRAFSVANKWKPFVPLGHMAYGSRTHHAALSSLGYCRVPSFQED